MVLKIHDMRQGFCKKMRNTIVVVVSNLGGLSPPVYLAQAGAQAALQSTLLGDSLT
jgi:hypothetical protein